MRCIGWKFLFPFQKGILQLINALKLIFTDLHFSPLNMKYINVQRLNQEIAEKAFGVIRSIYREKITSNAVEFTYRLRYLSIIWQPSSPAMYVELNLDDDVVILLQNSHL